MFFFFFFASVGVKKIEFHRLWTYMFSTEEAVAVELELSDNASSLALHKCPPPLHSVAVKTPCGDFGQSSKPHKVSTTFKFGKPSGVLLCSLSRHL